MQNKFARLFRQIDLARKVKSNVSFVKYLNTLLIRIKKSLGVLFVKSGKTIIGIFQITDKYILNRAN